MITGEQVKDAMIEKGIEYVDHHECGICGVMVFYIREGEQLFFNSGCNCSHKGPEPRSWQSAADWINMQSNKEWREKLALRFGVAAP